jgi:hypothetical protein
MVKGLDAIEERLLKHLNSMRSDFFHPYVGIKFRAYQKTLDFIEENMADAVVCNDRNDVFNCALRYLNNDGLVLEFGVKSGKTITTLANKPKLKKREIYGFDSFEGIPKDWSGTRTLKGQLSNLGKMPKVPKNVKLVKGWFKDSLPKFVKKSGENAALIHVDCDLYESTKDIFDNLGKKIVSGTVIIFDEFFNYPNWENHEFKAWNEFVKKEKIKFKYLCYAHTQVAVKIL